MGRFGELLRKLLFGGAVRPREDAEQLRIDFQARYHSFKLLLEANSRALEIMADLGQSLHGARPYGMTWVRARCTRVTTQIWRMIKHLDELAPGRHEPLRASFAAIRERINEALAGGPRAETGELVVALREVGRQSADQVGGKMASLGELRQQPDVKVPPGFVVTARGFWRFMEHNELQAEIDRKLQAEGAERLDDLYGLSSEIQRMVVRAELPDDLAQAILDHYRELEREEGEEVAVAVRSSSLNEDAPGSSFAGQHHSELNVGRASLLDTYKLIVASKYSLPAMTYRLNRGIRDEDVIMCVGVMSMVDAVAGGVLYTHNPVRVEDDSVLITSNWGLPLSVAEGRGSADQYVVARGKTLEIRQREVARASLDDAQIETLARLGLRLEACRGAPQDIEWAIDASGAVNLLQCRDLELSPAAGVVEQEPRAAEQQPQTALLEGGITASAGAAAGPVFIVQKGSEALEFPEGAVLVTVQPLPIWAPLLGRAAAVVAEHGTVAGHLATVAREFGVPALFGVEGAVERLRDDQIVTVDADGRRVVEGRDESLLARARPPVDRMAGSPVHGVFSCVTEQITPPNLLEPEAPEFRPENCKTYHDIARFCHEKAVREMFRFGKDHHFPERSSKQLYCDVPMQWWVLNLDDGFKKEIQDKYVRLEEIASIPMLAVWEGITAVPWEGPPSLDGKGFMSVMLEATTNPALAIMGRKSRFADRNYFMISKNYCSLNSRLGAHFSILEALVGERASENYVSFQFKGGAADYQRRLKRVAFVKEILDEYGFRVELNEDNAIARLDGHDQEFMQSRLKLLGYLNIHTRQLDMIMLNPAAVSYHRKKIHADMQGILAGS